MNPFLNRKSGANVDKWIGALNKMLEIPDVETVVPGHGPKGTRDIITTMKGYFEDMKLAVADPSKEKEIKEKYKSWKELPMMTSPGATMDYIRE
jgi:hypothetical protein